MLHASSALLGIRLSFRPKPQPEAGRLICREARPFLLRRHSNATASVSPRCQPVLQASQTESPEASTSSSIAAMTPVKTADGSFNDFPQTTGVYSIYSPDGQLQYIGLSRKIAISIATHAQDLPDLTHSAKFEETPGANKEAMIAKWQEWLQAAVNETGGVPPGNAKGNTTWSIKRSAPKPELKLTPGKGLQDLTCSVEDLVEQVVKTNKVVAFVKGTRTQPQCGFSYKVLSILNEAKVPFEVVNVLDEVYNPNLREAIKTYSQWPTIPQLYINGEFVGGADIIEEMSTKGELKELLSQ